jgi:hypothetical protein
MARLSPLTRRASIACSVALGFTITAGGLAYACPDAIIWTGNPSQGQSAFGILDCAAPGSLTVANDPTKGQVFAYNKPAGDKRCETRGINVNGSMYGFQNGDTYYIGWWSKLTNPVNNNADFQWKSYGTGMTQNYPFVVSALNGHASIFQRQPDSNGQTVWSASAPLLANQWNHYVIGLHLSDQLTGGWIQIWYNGQLQTFDNGSTKYACRTWDVSNDPKWGVYGAQTTAVTNYVAAPEIGTSYSDVANAKMPAAGHHRR